MANGTDTVPNMKSSTGEYIATPLDLDDDGLDDVNYAATKANVFKAISELNKDMEEDDQLFIYVIDHGGSKDLKKEISFIALWEEEELLDEELASALVPLINKGISVNVVLGQCYSGGFVDDLSNIGCIVATACSANQTSKAMENRPYDEFVYHWTSAINGFDALTRFLP